MKDVIILVMVTLLFILLWMLANSWRGEDEEES